MATVTATMGMDMGTHTTLDVALTQLCSLQTPGNSHCHELEPLSSKLQNLM